MDLLTMKNRIVNRGIASSLETQIYEWINEAYRDIWNAYDWSFKLTTGTLAYTAGTQLYAKSSIGSTVGKIHFMYDTATGKRLERYTQFKAVDLDPTLATSSSYPMAYSDIGTSIQLFPGFTTNGTLSVVYLADIADLASGTDTPSIPTRWHQVIVDLAYAKALLFDDDARYGVAYGLAKDGIERMKKEQNVNVDEISRMGFQMPNSGLVR